jgi:hypothetical protein
VALAETNVLAQNTNTSGNTYTTGSFTPPANSLLIVSVCWASGNVAIQNPGAQSISGGGLTWSRAVELAPTSSIGFWTDMVIFTAQVGGSPSSMTVTISAPGIGTGDNMLTNTHIVAYTGYNTSLPVQQAASDDVGTITSGNAQNPITYNFGLSPSATSYLFSSWCGGPQFSAGPMTPGTGWTELYDFIGSDAGGVSFESENITGVTSTAILINNPDTNNGSSGFWSFGSLAIEINAAGAADVLASQIWL